MSNLDQSDCELAWRYAAISVDHAKHRAHPLMKEENEIYFERTHTNHRFGYPHY